VQVTDCSYWAQHAKFSPDGTKLVFTALQTPNVNTDTGGPRGIAIIDISAYL
jgi:Tol biopolymer transport system component